MSLMKRLFLLVAPAALALTLTPSTAHADITAFWGISPTPSTRATRGFAVSINMVAVGFEFEYGNTREDEAKAAPGVRTYMFNGQLITPTGATQFYLSGGGGVFHEGYRDHTESGVATNIGGGVKLHLAGPLRLRIDYRVFSLRGHPVSKTPRRVYVGLSIG
jgi:hypothetical protein